MKKNELDKHEICEVASCDVPAHLREDFIVEGKREANVMGIGTPMPHPGGEKPTVMDKATDKLREQLDPRIAEYRQKIRSGEYNPKDFITAMTASEARVKGLLEPAGPTALDRELEAAPTQIEADRLSSQRVNFPLLGDENPAPVPPPRIAEE